MNDNPYYIRGTGCLKNQLGLTDPTALAKAEGEITSFRIAALTKFIERSSHYFAQLNVIHPFPEGNGRAQRVFFDKLAEGDGFEFDWGRISKEQFIDAVVHGYAVDTSLLQEVFGKTLIAQERSLVIDMPMAEQGMESLSIALLEVPSAEEPLAGKAQSVLDSMAKQLLDQMETQHTVALVSLANEVNVQRKALEE